MTTTAARWLVPLTLAPQAPRLRILCLPFAGAGANAYRSWAERVPPGASLLAVRLPGRESRFGEPPAPSMEAIVTAIVAEIADGPGAPLALFGHSFGASIAHDLAVALTAAGTPPAAVMLSGRGAPFLPPRRPQPLTDLADDAFVAVLRHMSGTPPEVFDHPDLVDLLLPVLRADVRLAEGVRRPRRRDLVCPVVAVGGVDDPLVPAADLSAWGEMCSGPFTVRIYPGGHFFIHDVAADLLTLLAAQADLR